MYKCGFCEDEGFIGDGTISCPECNGNVTKAKAQAGDLILVTNTQFSFGKYSAGDILEVLSANDAGVLTLKGEVFNEEFDVIDSSKLIDVVSKLIRRVSSLENQVRMTQNNTEGLAQEIGSVTSKVNELREITESNLSDIRFLGERGQTHNFSFNLRVDREADVNKFAEELSKLIEKGGDIS